MGAFGRLSRLAHGKRNSNSARPKRILPAGARGDIGPLWPMEFKILLPIARRRERSDPVLDLEPRHPVELAPIVGDEREIERARMRADQKIVGAAGGTSTKQRSLDVPEVRGRSFFEGQHLQPRDETLNAGGVCLSAVNDALGNAISQFRQADA